MVSPNWNESQYQEDSDDGSRGWLPLKRGGVGSGQDGSGRRGLLGQNGHVHHHHCYSRPCQEVAQAAQKAPAVADPETIFFVKFIFWYPCS